MSKKVCFLLHCNHHKSCFMPMLSQDPQKQLISLSERPVCGSWNRCFYYEHQLADLFEIQRDLPPVLEDSCRSLLRALKISLLLGPRTTVFPVLTMCKLFQPYSQDCQLPTDFIHSELLWVLYAFIQAAEEPRTSHISILRRSGRLGWTIPRLL